ncbi:accessory gland protein Acp62F-like [Drosophila obscura]|uniref:accessory gland protein Acp62F-like n=1 Tax=Drosophila obscura TaxID=7282 RepID=UPI000BA11148|nr:accessory gland protein Acp62F-like [Drosophila obscura]
MIFHLILYSVLAQARAIRDPRFVRTNTPYPPSLDCGLNATKSSCSTRCEETCQYKSRSCPPKICGGPCVCLEDYVIDERRSDCILLTDCGLKQLDVPSYQVSSVKYFGANYGPYIIPEGNVTES